MRFLEAGLQDQSEAPRTSLRTRSRDQSQDQIQDQIQDQSQVLDPSISDLSIIYLILSQTAV